MLELSTKYALRALLYLEQRPRAEYMQVKTLSEETSIPGPYLSKIVKKLAAKGLVDTRRGIAGGVRPRQSNKTLTFYDVCVALEDPIIVQQCFFTRHACNKESYCAAHPHWSKLKQNIIRFLQRSKIG